MKKHLWSYKMLLIIAVLIGVCNCVAAFFIDLSLFTVEAVLFFFLSGVVAFYLLRFRRHHNTFLRDLSKTLSPSSKKVLDRFPIPAVVTDAQGSIVWYNALFRENVLSGNDMYDEDIKEIITNYKPDFVSKLSGFDVCFANRSYTAFANSFEKNGECYYCYYFVDDSQQKAIIEEYHFSRPCVALFCVDNLEESFQDRKESEKIRILGDIENLFEQFINQTSGFMRKLDRDRFVAIIEERHMHPIMEKRFEILDRVRSINTFGRVPVTISIGVGRKGANLREDEQFAAQALDMALGRGGDQAAVRTESGYEFYGGVSKGVEKRSKIKTRIVASAISELLEAADNVVVMGHRAADLDCLASASVMAKCAMEYKKPVHIAIRKNENLADVLYKKLSDEGYADVFLHPDEVRERVTDGTLLIVTDTHNTKSVESPELLDACKTVVVIDHHRKMVNYIEKAVIFYHEPFASSASEMVAELSQYIGSKNFVRTIEAEALLSGIMLDTKNFSMKTGVRTFEAAAHLRRLGADTTEVKKMFSNTMEVYQMKSNLVSSAEIYKRCAISVYDEETDKIIVVSSQAADDLLSINGVDASFVIYKNDNAVCISARSMGSINVQLIMEALGGGGHQTMAGTRIEDADVNLVRQRLLAQIDRS